VALFVPPNPSRSRYRQQVPLLPTRRGIQPCRRYTHRPTRRWLARFERANDRSRLGRVRSSIASTVPGCPSTKRAGRRAETLTSPSSRCSRLHICAAAAAATTARRRRLHGDPQTPDKRQLCSCRQWAGQIRHWRRALHRWVERERARRATLDEASAEPLPPHAAAATATNITTTTTTVSTAEGALEAS